MRNTTAPRLWLPLLLTRRKLIAWCVCHFAVHLQWVVLAGFVISFFFFFFFFEYLFAFRVLIPRSICFAAAALQKPPFTNKAERSGVENFWIARASVQAFGTDEWCRGRSVPGASWRRLRSSFWGEPRGMSRESRGSRRLLLTLAGQKRREIVRFFFFSYNLKIARIKEQQQQKWN